MFSHFESADSLKISIGLDPLLGLATLRPEHLPEGSKVVYDLPLKNYGQSPATRVGVAIGVGKSIEVAEHNAEPDIKLANTVVWPNETLTHKLTIPKDEFLSIPIDGQSPLYLACTLVYETTVEPARKSRAVIQLQRTSMSFELNIADAEFIPPQTTG